MNLFRLKKIDDLSGKVNRQLHFHSQSRKKQPCAERYVLMNNGSAADQKQGKNSAPVQSSFWSGAVADISFPPSAAKNSLTQVLFMIRQRGLA